MDTTSSLLFLRVSERKEEKNQLLPHLSISLSKLYLSLFWWKLQKWYKKFHRNRYCNEYGGLDDESSFGSLKMIHREFKEPKLGPARVACERPTCWKSINLAVEDLSLEYVRIDLHTAVGARRLRRDMKYVCATVDNVALSTEITSPHVYKSISRDSYSFFCRAAPPSRAFEISNSQKRRDLSYAKFRAARIDASCNKVNCSGIVMCRLVSLNHDNRIIQFPHVKSIR